MLSKRIKSSFFFFSSEKKKKPRSNDFLDIYIYLKSLWPMFLITVPTVDGSVTIGFEGNLGFLSAICTSNIVHFTGCAIIPTTAIGSFSFFHLYILPLFYRWLFVSLEPEDCHIQTLYLILWLLLDAASSKVIYNMTLLNIYV
jgi:hypothetical protein